MKLTLGKSGAHEEHEREEHRMKEKERIFENDVEPSTAMHDHQLDCALINRDEEVDCEEEAQG